MFKRAQHRKYFSRAPHRRLYSQLNTHSSHSSLKSTIQHERAGWDKEQKHLRIGKLLLILLESYSYAKILFKIPKKNTGLVLLIIIQIIHSLFDLYTLVYICVAGILFPFIFVPALIIFLSMFSSLFCIVVLSYRR